MTIFIVDWNTESGDRGVTGYWTSRPTAKQLREYLSERFPEDWKAKTFNFEIKSLDEVSRMTTTEGEKWKELALELHDGDRCHYDHHGNCQTHNLHERPCPHEQIKELLNG